MQQALFWWSALTVGLLVLLTVVCTVQATLRVGRRVLHRLGAQPRPVVAAQVLPQVLAQEQAA